MTKQQIKNMIIALGIICILLIVCLASNLFTGYTSSNYFTFSFNSGNLNLIKTEAIQLETNKLTIFANGADVILEESQTDQLIVEEYCNRDLDDDKQFNITTSGDNTLIKTNSDEINYFKFFSFHSYKMLKIYIPASFANQISIETQSGTVEANIDLVMKDITIGSSSGDILVRNLTADLITLNSSSGTISLVSLTGNGRIKTTSGDIELESVQGDLRASASSGSISIFNLTGNGEISTTSGDMEIDYAQGDLRLSSSSGEISALDLTGGGNFSTISGDIEVVFQEITGDLLFNTSSGEVRCTVPESAVFEFLATTSSGDITTSFDDDLLFNKKGTNASGNIGNKAEYTLDITTISGDISVRY